MPPTARSGLDSNYTELVNSQALDSAGLISPQNSLQYDYPDIGIQTESTQLQSLVSSNANSTHDNSARSDDDKFKFRIYTQDLELQSLSGASTAGDESNDSAGVRSRRKYDIRTKLHVPVFTGAGPIARLRNLGNESRFSGWRFGVLTGCVTATFVLVSNIVLLLLGTFRHGGYQNGIAELARGAYPSITTISGAYHLVINILSTLLLGASNYCMQVLSSPTRSDVDRAHEKGQWLDVGVLSFRNLYYIDRRRFWLWCMLAISSLPLHLFYNSAIFQLTTGNKFAVQLISAQNQTEFVRLNSTTNATKAAELHLPHTISLTDKEWRDTYKSKYVSLYGDLFVFVDRVSLGLTQYDALNTTNASWTFEWPNPIILDPVENGTILDNVPWDGGYWTINLTHWERFQYNSLDDAEHNSVTETRMFYMHTAFAFVTDTRELNSAVQISLLFMSIVIFFNIVKVVAMLLVLLDGNKWYLVTCGDAVASFLEHPQAETKGYCVASRQELCKNRMGLAKKRSKSKESNNNGEERVDNGSIWRPMQRFPISWTRRKVTTAICGIPVLVLIIIDVMAGLTLDGWAASSSTYFNKSGYNTSSVLMNAFLVNAPQLLLSGIYLTFNAQYTTIALAREWNRMGATRKGLRVTAPKGEQRSTYFLQLPYRWAVPLMITSGGLHWLMSQAIFLVRLDVRDRNGEIDTKESLSACGWSGLALVVLTVVGGCLGGVTWVTSFLPLRENVPMATSCSAVISAACHPPADDYDAHLKEVQWGVVGDAVNGVGHCTFTSLPITKPEVGKKYA